MNVCHCQTQYCGAEWAAEEEKYEKKRKKKSEEKNLGRNYKTSRPTDGMPKYEHDELNVKLGNTCFIFILWHRNLC